MKHATTKIGEYTIPLIGVPESATEQTCEVCGKTRHLTDVEVNEDGKCVCKDKSQCGK